MSISIPNGLTDEKLQEACRDYAFLMDRHYPEKGALKLAGDRYRMTRDQRTLMYRGISAADVSAARQKRIITRVEGLHAGIDAYNVLFSLLSYRLGRPVFLSTDGLFRDAGNVHGRLKDDDIFMDCMELLASWLAAAKPAKAGIFFDSPVSHSEHHARLLEEKLVHSGMNYSCSVIHSADFALRHNAFDVLATSDTGIIDSVSTALVDIPRQILENTYHVVLLNLARFIANPAR